MGMCVSVVFRGEGVCVCVISFKALGFGFVFVFQFSKPLESTLKLQYWMMRERETERQSFVYLGLVLYLMEERKVWGLKRREWHMGLNDVHLLFLFLSLHLKREMRVGG